jgi:NAD(P)-dependent dehydrogenase (short-subunit alcohol dehydrogenase family)
LIPFQVTYRLILGQFGQSKGITVNSIAPGPVITDLVPADAETAFSDFVGMTRAAKRVGTVQDIADAVLLIVNEKSQWITGQFISASGGITGQ